MEGSPLFHALFTIVALPFRALFWTFNALGRMASLVLGFALMVGGVVLLAGNVPWVGVPLLLFGIYLSLRALG